MRLISDWSNHKDEELLYCREQANGLYIQESVPKNSGDDVT